MARSVLKRAAAWRPGQLGVNTAHAGAWTMTRAALQGLTLILMARAFGPDGYGRISGTVALYVTLAQLVGLGSGIALVKHLSRNGDLATRFHITQVVFAVSGFALFIIGLALSRWLLGDALDTTTYACLALAELAFAPLLLPLVYRYQAEEQLFLSGLLLTVVPTARLLAVSMALVFSISSVATFSIAYLAWLFAAVALALAWFRPSSRPASNAESVRSILREGAPFVVGGVTATASAELDKTILLRLAGSAVAGHYSAAYRLVSAATIPVGALVLAAAPRMFRGDYRSRVRLPHKLVVCTLVYASLAATVLYCLAPLAHVLLGEGFRPSETILRILCLLLVTSSLRQLINAALTTSDRQHLRNLVELGTLICALTLLLVLVPLYQAAGAAAAVILSDVWAVVAGYAALSWGRERDKA